MALNVSPSIISNQPYPESTSVNAFTQLWTNLKFYAFSPFISLPRVTQEIWQDEAERILVVPT